MIDVKDSILKSLDGQSPEIFEYLPYLLKDLWEIGSSADVITRMIRNNDLQSILKPMEVLDIGCGKGAVAISIAKEFNANVTGIDAMPAFIDEASSKAVEMKVDNLCSFVVGDIRTVLPQYNNFNLAVVGSIGPILGYIEETLSKLSNSITDSGYIILDDAYLPDRCTDTDMPYLSKDEFFKQIEKSSFKIIDKYIHSSDDARTTDDEIYMHIENRAIELIKMYPEKAELFEGYLKQQRDENDIIENKIVNIALLLKKK